jgi:hypothetical protein
MYGISAVGEHFEGVTMERRSTSHVLRGPLADDHVEWCPPLEDRGYYGFVEDTSLKGMIPRRCLLKLLHAVIEYEVLELLFDYIEGGYNRVSSSTNVAKALRSGLNEAVQFGVEHEASGLSRRISHRRFRHGCHLFRLRIPSLYGPWFLDAGGLDREVLDFSESTFSESRSATDSEIA